MKITIKKEFKDLIFPLTDDELRLLEQAILNEGVRDPKIIMDSIAGMHVVF